MSVVRPCKPLATFTHHLLVLEVSAAGEQLSPCVAAVCSLRVSANTLGVGRVEGALFSTGNVLLPDFRSLCCTPRFVHMKPATKRAKPRVLEAAHVNHRYTPAELKVLHKQESHDYFPSNSPIYRRWLSEYASPRLLACCPHCVRQPGFYGQRSVLQCFYTFF